MSKEKYVYITESKHNSYYPLYTVYLDASIEEPKQYRELFEKLENADDKTRIAFILNTNGGQFDTALQIVDYIRKTKAETIAVIYKAHSAGSVIACACESVVLTPYSMMMIHTIQTYFCYQKDNVKHKLWIDYHNDVTHKLYSDIYKGFYLKKK